MYGQTKTRLSNPIAHDDEGRRAENCRNGDYETEVYEATKGLGFIFIEAGTSLEFNLNNEMIPVDN